MSAPHVSGRDDGLSPRVRGSQPVFNFSLQFHGSIPACAGEPVQGAGKPVQPRVYPRVCGGATPLECGRTPLTGLSPRVRGSHPLRMRQNPAHRSIPACAGEPRRRLSAYSPTTVYPRVCGGAASAQLWLGPARGLSPRVRGSRHHVDRRRRGSRSIPACAGEPGKSRLETRFSWVYPRVCGGASRRFWHGWHRDGLSPRVRGSLPMRMRWDANPRSIPACAGEPVVYGHPSVLYGVYPRVCGGAGWELLGVSLCRGLSPRVRGSLGLDLAALERDRSIPACAGEPGSRTGP